MYLGLSITYLSSLYVAIFSLIFYSFLLGSMKIGIFPFQYLRVSFSIIGTLLPTLASIYMLFFLFCNLSLNDISSSSCYYYYSRLDFSDPILKLAACTLSIFFKHSMKFMPMNICLLF